MSRLPTHTSALTALTPLAAAKMTSEALGTVNDAFSENHSLLAPTSSALNTAISVIDAIKDGLVTASQPGAELIETDIAAQQHSLPRIGSSMNITASSMGAQALSISNSNSKLILKLFEL